jgi:predicted transposase/invertase (TIGR01784 family)
MSYLSAKGAICTFDIMGWMGDGMTDTEILAKYPELNESHIAKAKETIIKVWRDKELAHSYHLHNEERIALLMWMQRERREGYEEGRREAARQLKAENMPLDQIAEGTGLSLDEIAKL